MLCLIVLRRSSRCVPGYIDNRRNRCGNPLPRCCRPWCGSGGNAVVRPRPHTAGSRRSARPANPLSDDAAILHSAPSHRCRPDPTAPSRRPDWSAVSKPGRYHDRHTAGGNPPPRNNRFQGPEPHRRARAGRRASTPAVRTAAFHRECA